MKNDPRLCPDLSEGRLGGVAKQIQNARQPPVGERHAEGHAPGDVALAAGASFGR